MPIVSDFHLHSSCSGDSTADMESMILRGIQLGLARMCFTEHHDIDIPPSPEAPVNIYLLDTDAYLALFRKMRSKYEGRIRLSFGVELGLQPQVAAKNAAYVRGHAFDFLIGSSHVCHGRDPYYPSFYEGRTEEEAYREYFTSIIDNLEAFSDFDVYGHLDYIVRYGPNKDRDYSYEKYQDLLDRILELLLEKGIGLELNTGGHAKGLRELHPCTKVLKRYRKMGGEIVTVGSDAHAQERICADFSLAEAVLKECGFRHYTVFEERKPIFLKL